MKQTLDERVLDAIKQIPVDDQDHDVSIAFVEKGRETHGRRRRNLYRWILLKGDTRFLKLATSGGYAHPNGRTYGRWAPAPARMNRILHMKCFPFLTTE